VSHTWQQCNDKAAIRKDCGSFVCAYVGMIVYIQVYRFERIRVTTAQVSRKPKAVLPPKSLRPGKERVLVEFSASLLQRADEAARKMHKNRSELIRTAVEQHLNEIEAKKFEQDLAAAYMANAEMNLELIEEFAHVDRETF
jgi:predicted transcriptional regulator